MANKSRPNQVIFRASDEEVAKLNRNIELANKSKQEYLLTSALECKILNTDGAKELIPMLKQVGNNLNQTTRALNEINVVLKDSNFFNYRKIGEVLTEAERNQKELNELWQQLRQYLQSVE